LIYPLYKTSRTLNRLLGICLRWEPGSFIVAFAPGLESLAIDHTELGLNKPRLDVSLAKQPQHARMFAPFKPFQFQYSICSIENGVICAIDRADPIAIIER